MSDKETDFAAGTCGVGQTERGTPELQVKRVARTRSHITRDLFSSIPFME